MTVPTFTLTGTVDSLNGSTLAPLEGRIVGLRSNIPAGTLINVGGTVTAVSAVSLSVGSDGSIPSVSLLANDSSLNLGTTLQWQIKIQGFAAWWFDAPAAGDTVDLSDLLPDHLTSDDNRWTVEGF